MGVAWDFGVCGYGVGLSGVGRKARCCLFFGHSAASLGEGAHFFAEALGGGSYLLDVFLDGGDVGNVLFEEGEFEDDAGEVVGHVVGYGAGLTGKGWG